WRGRVAGGLGGGGAVGGCPIGRGSGGAVPVALADGTLVLLPGANHSDETMRSLLTLSDVMDLTQGVGVDAALECVGTSQSFATAFDVARPGATVGFVGIPTDVEVPIDRMFAHNISLRGGVAPVRKYIPELLEDVL